MLVCTECGEEFTQDDSVYECKECIEPFCEDCSDRHDCLKNSASDYDNKTCDECGEFKEIMKECPSCSDIYCESCIDAHTKDTHIDFKEKDYNEYISDKVVDNLEKKS